MSGNPFDPNERERRRLPPMPNDRRPKPQVRTTPALKLQRTGIGRANLQQGRFAQQ